MEKGSVVLNFPNPSRIYDASRRSVCFWGNDKAREIVFLVDDAMLTKPNPSSVSDESSLLATFDRNRDQILEIARTPYKGGPRNRYTIS
ncbi:DUF1488 domain-containing protein [Paraburkholderia tagetis]|uniref:DUF1488 domain-containing protein n=1 Tax=Paraburkholderia tagetis TaxID=2913261 RepID=A0A9X1RSF7_9BURK|nr:DUF1488 domain-containing protein [Paraburkholderia tagetis]MCG5076515.1 DUF1488 domain-containing protein [Paraburkholderia tagetis]